MPPTPQKTILGGLAGTIVMTLMMYYVAPLMLGGPMDIAAMLGNFLGIGWWAGMILHFVIGSVILPLVYVYALYGLLPGDPWLKGVLYGVLLWLIAQVVMMPMMGGGFFSANAGGLMAVMASLLGHVVYGAILGAIADGTP